MVSLRHAHTAVATYGMSSVDGFGVSFELS